MKNTRTLSLKSEALAELSVGELGVVAGAAQGPSLWNTCPLLECINSRYIPCTV